METKRKRDYWKETVVAYEVAVLHVHIVFSIKEAKSSKAKVIVIEIVDNVDFPKEAVVDDGFSKGH